MIASAGNGSRNSLLFWGACRFAELVTQGVITEGLAEEILIDAASKSGLHITEARKTVQSAFQRVRA